MKATLTLFLFVLIGTGSAIFSQTVTIGTQVSIGTQVWMTKNLDVATFRNGDSIPQVKKDKEWKKAGENQQPAWCYYNNNQKNGKKYGKIYNWYAVNDPRGLAPVGYHIPSDAEWTQLTNYLGGVENAAAKMKNISGWAENGNGTNSSGFSGLPGGDRSGNGAFSYVGLNGSWWSSTEYVTFTAWHRSLYYYNGILFRGNNYRSNGFSVRCLKD
ncbi:MAG: fibrobacter succinogenes major paralogous domain-containing protein [Crocinitomicaceae bacterium]